MENLDEGSLKEKGQSSKIKSDPHSINVIFVYNGHEWDAYKVLGIPAGSSREKVEEAFKKTISRVDKESKSFFTVAYQAILEGRKRSGSPKN